MAIIRELTGRARWASRPGLDNGQSLDARRLMPVAQ